MFVYNKRGRPLFSWEAPSFLPIANRRIDSKRPVTPSTLTEHMKGRALMEGIYPTSRKTAVLVKSNMYIYTYIYLKNIRQKYHVGMTDNGAADTKGRTAVSVSGGIISTQVRGILYIRQDRHKL